MASMQSHITHKTTADPALGVCRDLFIRVQYTTQEASYSSTALPLSPRSISLQLAEGCVGVAGEFCNGAASDVFSIPEYLNFPIIKQDLRIPQFKAALGAFAAFQGQSGAAFQFRIEAVSYTHLTLPTNA